MFIELGSWLSLFYLCQPLRDQHENEPGKSYWVCGIMGEEEGSLFSVFRYS